MKIFFKFLFIALSVVVLASLIFGLSPTFYFADEITGVVRESADNKPIPNAVVVARWTLWGGSLVHSSNVGELNTQLAISDSRGRYTLPGWIKFSPKLFAVLPTDEPKLYVYKYGYVPKVQPNGLKFPAGKKGDNHKVFLHWYGSTEITLDVLQGTQKEKMEKFERSQYFLPSIYKDCEKTDFLPLLLELDKQYQDKERYLFSIYQEDRWLTPWFFQKNLLGESPCLDIKNVLINARKLRRDVL